MELGGRQDCSLRIHFVSVSFFSGVKYNIAVLIMLGYHNLYGDLLCSPSRYRQTATVRKGKRLFLFIFDTDSLCEVIFIC